MREKTNQIRDILARGVGDCQKVIKARYEKGMLKPPKKLELEGVRRSRLLFVEGLLKCLACFFAEDPS